MNSLKYLSRQFDVLASPTTPPSTPTGEDELEYTLKRVRTSPKSLSAERNAAPGHPGAHAALKRSMSSPPGFAFPTLPAPSARRHSISSAAAGKGRRVPRRSDATRSALRRTFLVRLCVQLWLVLCAAWAALNGRRSSRGRLERQRAGAVEEATGAETESDEKDSEDETRQSLEPEKGGDDVRHEQLPALILELPLPPPLPQPVRPQHPSITFITRHLNRTVSEPLSPSESVTPPKSGTPEPGAPQRITPLHVPKTLVLDLDETLIHSTSRPASYPGAAASASGVLGLLGRRSSKPAGHVVEVVLGNRHTLYHVYKRPFVDYFLRKVSGWYTLVIFTASMQEYADPVIDWLDAGRGILERRLFRESCTQLPNGSYSKDLSIIEPDLARVCLVDNSPICYSLNEANGIPIEGWTHDPSDEALLDLLPVLDSLRFTSDVRRVLGIRGFS